MTLEELKAKLPADLKPWADQFGSALLAMSAQELQDWIVSIANGQSTAAYEALLKKIPNADLFTEWTALNNDWTSANAKNADKMALQLSAVSAILQVVLKMALLMVGL